MIDLASGPPLQFDSDRLTIRRYELDDAESLYAAARESIREVYRFLPWCHPDYDVSESRDWLARVEPDWQAERVYNFAIISREDGRFLGGVGLYRIDEHPVANLGYWIRSSRAGEGIATEATLGLLRYAFTHLHLIRIEIIMSVENEPSRRVAEKAGGIHEGILRNRLLLHGRGHDAHSYSLLRSDVL